MNHPTILKKETKNLSQIGLEKEKSKTSAKMLNILLASYSIFYQNTRGYHWNLKGDKFFELHLKFEDLYDSLYLKIDAIAERIVTLGYTANHNFTDYKTISKIVERTEVNDAFVAAEDILNSLKTLITLQREILSFSDDMGDEGSSNLMSDTIAEQEKLTWMYSAFLEK